MQKLTKLAPKKTNKEWYVLDCTNVRLGKAATTIAKKLMGKDVVTAVDYLPENLGIIALNTDKISYFPKKAKNKFYQWHSGFPGGFKEISLEDQMKKDSTKVLFNAVSGMLPKNKNRDKFLSSLFIYKDADHLHAAQKPLNLVVNNKA